MAGSGIDAHNIGLRKVYAHAVFYFADTAEYIAVNFFPRLIKKRNVADSAKREFRAGRLLKQVQLGACTGDQNKDSNAKGKTIFQHGIFRVKARNAH
jgi:hypothetical protein